MTESDLEKVYNKFVALLNASSPYKMSTDEQAAINEAIEASELGEIHTHKQVME